MLRGQRANLTQIEFPTKAPNNGALIKLPNWTLPASLLVSEKLLYQVVRFHRGYHDHFEYVGNTEIERIRKKGETTIEHDRIIFDNFDEALEYFNDRCGEYVGYYA